MVLIAVLCLHCQSDRVIKEQIIDMALNGSGIRDTARVLGISTDTVLNELTKKSRRSAM
jgi:transposase-like protein